MEFNEEIDASKILFTGLDGAGKTSIILALQREFSQIATLKPTRQAQRKIFEFLGKKIAEWDLGGQERYRIAYLKAPGKYFDKTAVCIYVIDIQDEDRLMESLSYLKDVVEQFKILEIKPPIIILFHKYDPVYKKLYPVEGAKKVLDIKKQAEKIVGEHQHDFYKTSIYELWSIMTAFSKILLKLYPQSELIDKTLQEFSEKQEAEGMIVLDNNSLIIGQYFKNDESRLILEQSTPYFLTLNDSFSNTYQEILHNQPGADVNKAKSGMKLERSGKSFYFDEIDLSKEGLKSLYLLIMKEKDEFNKSEINKFIEIFKDLLKSK